jgi:hypothetical protein
VLMFRRCQQEAIIQISKARLETEMEWGLSDDAPRSDIYKERLVHQRTFADMQELIKGNPPTMEAQSSLC